MMNREQNNLEEKPEFRPAVSNLPPDPRLDYPEVEDNQQLSPEVYLPFATATTQQNKLLAALGPSGPGSEDPFKYSGGNISFEDSVRDELLKQLGTGVLDTKVSTVLRRIETPYERGVRGNIDTANVYSAISSSDRQVCAILAHFSGNGVFSRRDGLQPSDMNEFVQRFPDPLQFDIQAQQFIRNIRSGTGQDIEKNIKKQQQYEQALDSFMRTVYGKRYEYYQQYRLLRAEAAERFGHTIPSAEI